MTWFANQLLGALLSVAAIVAVYGGTEILADAVERIAR